MNEYELIHILKNIFSIALSHLSAIVMSELGRDFTSGMYDSTFLYRKFAFLNTTYLLSILF